MIYIKYIILDSSENKINLGKSLSKDWLHVAEDEIFKITQLE